MQVTLNWDRSFERADAGVLVSNVQMANAMLSCRTN
jgi:hypothetical protein